MTQTDSTAKHTRRMPAPRLKGQTVPVAGKPGVALFQGRYVRIGQVTEYLADRHGPHTCCIKLAGQMVIGWIRPSEHVCAKHNLDRATQALNTRIEDPSYWQGAEFIPL